MKRDAYEFAAAPARIEIAVEGFRRVWDQTPTGLRTQCVSIGDRSIALAPAATDDTPECGYDGLTCLPHRKGGTFPPLQYLGARKRARRDDGLDPARGELTLRWEQPEQHMHLERTWTVFPGVPVMSCRAAVRSESVPQAKDEWKRSFDNVIETLPIDLTGWRVRAVSLCARTDYHNELVREEEHVVAAGQPLQDMHGNLLLLLNPSEDAGFFVLHESPPEDERRPECRATFQVGAGGIRVMDWGLLPHEVLPHRLRRSYDVAIGAYAGGPGAGEIALRKYLKTRYPLRPGEQAVVANPWGDRHCHERFCEAFLLDEITASADVGATHYQIDDGWQAVGTLNDMTNQGLARPRSFWDIHPTKLPAGFEPLAQRARECGIELALWFAPDMVRGFRNWREDVEILLAFWRRYDIRLIKVDGIRVYTKDAEECVLNLLEGLVRRSNGRIRLNLDVTNGLRMGYFPSQRFGTIFVENRYVMLKPDSPRCYLPWQVLRNLWRLSRYVPPEKLQFEFANVLEAKAAAAAAGHAEDPLLAGNLSWEYLCAIPLLASPLCWLQPSRLPADARAQIRRVMELHRRIAPELATAFTFPVGEEPNGSAWTGFRACQPGSPDTGLLMVMRELNDRPAAMVRLGSPRLPPGMRLRLNCLSHDEPPREAVVDDEGGVELRIDQPHTFRLWRYGQRAGCGLQGGRPRTVQGGTPPHANKAQPGS